MTSNRHKLSFTFSCVVALSVCVGCGREDDQNEKESGKSHTPPVVVQEDDSTNSLQADVEDFFERFSEALKAPDPNTAESFVALKHRERFKKGYKFWQGTRFYDAEVLEGSLKSDVLRVQVRFQLPSGRTDREVKQIKREEARWVLLDS